MNGHAAVSAPPHPRIAPRPPHPAPGGAWRSRERFAAGAYPDPL